LRSQGAPVAFSGLLACAYSQAFVCLQCFADPAPTLLFGTVARFFRPASLFAD
jgi:hypothetical protein